MSVISVHRPTIWMAMSIIIKDRFKIVSEGHIIYIYLKRGKFKEGRTWNRTVKVI